MSMPAGTPVCGKLPKKPRRFLGACSTAISAAPPHSPPTPRPWAIRSRTSTIGAAIPMLCTVGRTPIRVVARPITRRVTTRVFFLPNLSPMCPAMMPPMGRAKKPTPKVPKASRVPDSGSDEGKNSLPKTSAAAVPKMKKSYHSMALPMKLANATRFMLVRGAVAPVSVVTTGFPSLGPFQALTPLWVTQELGVAYVNRDHALSEEVMHDCLDVPCRK
jgi:hypothetical protein